MPRVSSSTSSIAIASPIKAWFEQRKWQIFEFQAAVWSHYANGCSGLIHATTGSGKTYAVWFALLNQYLLQESLPGKQSNPKSAGKSSGLKMLWITPMRALASDTTKALQEPLAPLGLAWQVGQRTGDTATAERARQSRRLPEALVTTPESLMLMLSKPGAREQFDHLELIVLDEWHELMGNKRGVQVQLALARLRKWRPNLRIWGLSATLGNLDHAMQVLLNGRHGVLVQGKLPKLIEVDTLLPESTERFPWGGHLGLRMLPRVIEQIEASSSNLIFTNTRAQAEMWYSAILEAKPDWAGLIALHHGSLDREVRDWVEQSLKAGQLKAVVCTSSLDLGVDFSPVERVLQIGSAKGVARVLQRAGRSGHAPGQVSRISLVPTHALEIIEGAALKDAVAQMRVEARFSPEAPLDVLVQHVVTIALAEDTQSEELFEEVKSTWAYRNLTQQQWNWVLAFAGHGGNSLAAYPEYHKISKNEAGLMTVPDKTIARRHRMSMGTIVSDASMWVKFLSGGKIGTVEESFIGRLKKGDCFLFAGRLLELVRVHEMTAYVRKASGRRAAVPRWNGGKMPLSSELADCFVARLAQAKNGQFEGPEMQLVQSLLEVQRDWSEIPSPEVLLVERLTTREGEHLFVYPFAGRPVHIGLSSLIAYRLGQYCNATFSIAVNDYGFELLSAETVDWSQWLADALNPSTAPADLIASLNASELAQRRFREIARIAGLIFQGFPGAPKSNKQLQASSSLFFEVFKKYDPENLLLIQAQQEVLSQELELDRLTAVMANLQSRTLKLIAIERPTPLAFPLMIERLREKLTTEKLSDRIERMVRELEKAATS